MSSYTNCPNCSSTITCGCQKKKASDGTALCSKCIDQYEKLLVARRTSTGQEWREDFINRRINKGNNGSV